MQPTPDEDPTPNEDPTPAPAAAPAAAKGRSRLAVIVGLGLLTLLVVGGGVVLFVYDRATAPDRSSPVLSADAFLHAALVERSAARVRLYVCDSWPAEQALGRAITGLDPAVSVTWGNTATRAVRQGDPRMEVAMSVTFTLGDSGVFQRSVETWLMVVVEEPDGWRVCSLTRA